MLAEKLEDPADNDPESQPLTGRILCVDDESQILMSLKRVFRRAGHTVSTANSGADGLKYLAENEVDIVISDMRMPEMDGHHFLAEVAKQYPDTVRMLLTGYSDMESTIGAINNGSIYRYIAKPWDDTDLLMSAQRALEIKSLRDERDKLNALTKRQNRELQALNTSLEAKVQERTAELEASKGEIEKGYVDSIAVFARIISMREGDTAAHGERIAKAANLVAEKLELNATQKKDLHYAALLHDIGKIGLSDDLLKTPYDQMGDEQRELYQQHVTNGEALLVTLPPLHGAASIIRSHHEQMNGGGYPDQLKGEEIPIEARILLVVNEYEELLSGMLAGRPMDSASAINYLVSHANIRYDANVVEAFIAINKNLEQTESVQKEMILNIDNVEPGMILAEDVYLRENVLMLRSGQVLTATFIAKYKALKKGSKDSMLLKIRN
jgi:response regulator RpfG family c-di-GMP phosphodiesterase